MNVRQRIQFLLACSRNATSADFTERIRSLSPDGRSWPALIETAQAHGVDALVYSILQQWCSDAIPAEAIRALADQAAANAVSSLRQQSELADILNMLRANSIEAIPFKGTSLSASVYGNVALRRSTDLDILIRKRDRTKVADILCREGYTLTTPVSSNGEPIQPDKYEYHFEKKGATAAEFRWRISQRQFSAPLDLDYVLPRCEMRPVAGIQTLVLAPEDLLLILCAHGVKHQWRRVMWLCDVAVLIRENPCLDWNAVQQRASTLGLGRVVRLSLLLVSMLLEDPVPVSLEKQIQRDPTAIRVAGWLRDELLEQRVQPENSRYYQLILDRRIDRWRSLVRSRLRGLKPKEKDFAMLSLPRRLSFGYYLVRWTRLIWERTLQKTCRADDTLPRSKSVV